MKHNCLAPGQAPQRALRPAGHTPEHRSSMPANARADFESLLSETLPSAYRMAVQLTRNSDDAADLVQEAAVSAFRAFHTFTPGSNFRAWFFRITTNAFYQSYRKKRREPETTSVEDAGALYLFARTAEAGLHQQSPDPAGLVLGKLDQEQITEAIGRLPEEYRIPAALFFVEELAYAEIAEILGCPVGTVRSRLHRGRRLLQKALWEIAEQHGIVAALKMEAG